MPRYLPRPGPRIFFRPVSGAANVFGVSQVAITDTVTTAGVRTTFGVSTVPIVVAVTSAGARKTFAVSSVLLTVAPTTVAKITAKTGSTVTVAVTVTTAANVPVTPVVVGGISGPAFVVTRAMDVHETAKWRQQLDNDEIALILALL